MASEPFDTYGNLVTKQPRHRLCRCPVKCPRFRCRGAHHRGSRSVPWCVGGSEPGTTTLCATCAVRKWKRAGFGG